MLAKPLSTIFLCQYTAKPRDALKPEQGLIETSVATLKPYTYASIFPSSYSCFIAVIIIFIFIL